MPSVASGGFLNTGAIGPLPRRAHAALVHTAAVELEHGRKGRAVGEATAIRRERAKRNFARLLGADPSTIALTHSTTEGINIALTGLSWQPGDRLITAVTEHPAVLNPAGLLAKRFNIRIEATRIGLPGVDPLAELEAALMPGARAVVLSHVCWTTGIVLPIRQLAEAAHEAGAVMIVDGAQSAGMVPVDVNEIGADAYACSGQKWVCGPIGTGALHVAEKSLELFTPSFAGYLSGSPAPDGQDFAFSSGAQRFEAITLHDPSLEALSVSLEWLGSEEVGWSWAHSRIRELGLRCCEALSQIPGVTVVTPESAGAGLITFAVEGVPPPTVTERLEKRNIFIRDIASPPANRASTGFYNLDEEIDELVEAVAELAASIGTL
ncbi:MAG: aminotransferase class V-fold PLP-dependent enzyme [Actinomycetota bacterium]|nr:aminotransferase class V-fold PLP-dependent enzyme [Actinomycetota bacterium]